MYMPQQLISIYIFSKITQHLSQPIHCYVEYYNSILISLPYPLSAPSIKILSLPLPLKACKNSELKTKHKPKMTKQSLEVH